PGTYRCAEYSTKMPTAESSSTASHIQDCWEISTGAMNTVTARVMPSTAMRVTMAGTESDRVRCAGACVEVMGDSAFRGAGGVPESAGGGRAGATRRPGRSGGGGRRIAPVGSADRCGDLLARGLHDRVRIRTSDDVGLGDAQRFPDRGHRRDGGHRLGGLGGLGEDHDVLVRGGDLLTQLEVHRGQGIALVHGL